MRSRRATVALATAVGSLLLASAADAATLSVDDDRNDCPTAQYTSIQAAVDAAATGDTVAVCPGDYEEGPGQPGTNALTISKSIILKGAGAGLVHISPKATTPTGGQILEGAPSIRNGLGDIVAVNGTPSKPIKVDISGVTVDGHDASGRPIAVEAGIVFLDAKGSVVRSHVTNVVTSEGDGAYDRPGGWRGAQPGIGIVQTSNALAAPVDGARLLTIDRTRVDKYNQAGILIDGATNDSAPYVASGTIDSAVVTASQIVGRTECINYQGTGNCSSVGLLTTGPLFGQDGIKATNNARIKVSDTLISQNLVNGTGAPVRSTVAANGTVTANSTNNANLGLAAGIRLVGAGLTSYSGFGGQVLLSSAATSNITDNAYGVINVAADGSTVRSGNLASTSGIGDVFKAEDIFWGLNYYRTTNPGPAIAPTDNPPVPETAVTGAPVTDPFTGLPTSASVDFSPYRSGQAADMAHGEWPVLSAPLPVDDAAPTVALAGDTTVARGATLTLAATASDDFGVKRVSFYDGATKLGTSAGPEYKATEAIAAGAACGPRAVSAVAEDSLGQTVIAKGTVTVTGCDVAPAPAAPTIGAKALGKLTAKGAVLELSPVAAAGIAKVDVYLGTRRVCALTAAPWRCTVVPTGADVGTQALRAVVTDALGRSAETAQKVVVARFAPRGLSLKIASRNVAKGNVRKTLSARVLLPTGVTAKQGCSGGSATVVVKRAGRSVSNSTVKVKSNCTFVKSVTAKRVKAGSRAFSYSIRFTGTKVLTAVSTTRRSS